MSDDLESRGHHAITHDGESYIKLADAAETFKRLWAWRRAVYNALTEWHDPPRDGETPKDALRRLIQYEITAALDPAVSQAAADLVATARREGMEELERHFRKAAAGTPIGHEDHQRGASTYNWLIYCATTISAIKDRAAAGEVK